MIFDLTADFDNLDFSKEENILYEKFRQLIITLITISSSAKKQREIIGYGCVTDEMALDFDNYSSYTEIYIKMGLINQKQLVMLNDLNHFLEERSGDKNPEFWDDDNLEVHPDWEIAKNKAKAILIELNMSNLDIEIERIEKYRKTLFGKKKPIVQTTKIKLLKNRIIK